MSHRPTGGATDRVVTSRSIRKGTWARLNQAFFKRILVYSDTRVSAELAPPFDVFLGPEPQASLDDAAAQAPQNTKEPTQSSGLLRRPTNSNRSALCHSVLSLAHGLSRTFMVGLTGFEPATP
jgi:hypothetical protein